MRNFTLFTAVLICGFVFGWLAAIDALGFFGLKAVAGAPNWREWALNSDDRTQVYALGHFLSEGQLPPPKSARYFVRGVDEDGYALRGDCDYMIKGPAIAARWWTLRVSADGKSDTQSTLSAGETILNQDGTLLATISRHPSPGNWIIPPQSGTLSVEYVISEPAFNEAVELPLITKSGC